MITMARTLLITSLLLAPLAALQAEDAAPLRTDDHVPLMLLRRKTMETAFVWAVSLDGKPVTLETQPARDAGGKPPSAAVATAVSVRSGGQRWCLLVNPDKQAVQVSLPEGAWTSSGSFAVRPLR